jgi:3-phenylpropionate/cinnamic acid dioxygenase small subunit
VRKLTHSPLHLCLVLPLATMTTPTDPPSSYRAIEHLIASYAELVDDGDFAGVGALLADATFAGSAGSVTGQGAIERMLRDNVIVYDDGTPRTKHVTTNIAIEVDEAAGRAVARSYFTVLQALPDLALQPIVSGRYEDRFERRDGRWRFAERRVLTDLVGDVSRHLRRSTDNRSTSGAPKHAPIRDDVPAIVMRYFALDAGDDVEAVVGLFTEDATVTDEGETRRGIDAIRAWRAGPAAEYEYATTITGSEHRGDRQFRVTARLVGNFPGGTADLNFDFTVENDHIRALKIAP